MRYKLIPIEEAYLSSLSDASGLSNTGDEPEEFKNPVEAIKWCNEKFKELGDKKYKQIANYLHIYK